MAKSILGVDLGTDSISIALCKNGEAKKVATAPMPQGLMKDGRVASAQAVGGVLRDVMRENHIRASEAAIVFPNEICFLRNISVPRMSADQVKINIPYEFSDYLSEEPRNYTFDYAVLGEAKAEAEGEEDKLDLMAVAVPNAVLEEARTTLEVAGLKMAKAAPVEYAFISVIRAAKKKGIAADEYCVLDLGYRSVRMNMFKGDRHMVTRVLEFGLKNIDDLIAEQMGVDVHLAHNYFISNYEDCQKQEYCVNAYNNIAVELARALNFYHFSNPDSTLSDVWLCGGGAAIEPLREAIRTNLENMKLHEAGELVHGSKGIDDWHRYLAAVGITME
ncbi:MAG: hypothetical protein E7425_00845 [Ruminococcaceae bacterium]|jgi:type IV pilus assembly protein PilM|nr:hypothetical protein [Oscillospiraceae bacterium]